MEASTESLNPRHTNTHTHIYICVCVHLCDCVWICNLYKTNSLELASGGKNRICLPTIKFYWNRRRLLRWCFFLCECFFFLFLFFFFFVLLPGVFFLRTIALSVSFVINAFISDWLFSTVNQLHSVNHKDIGRSSYLSILFVLVMKSKC